MAENEKHTVAQNVEQIALVYYFLVDLSKLSIHSAKVKWENGL